MLKDTMGSKKFVITVLTVLFFGHNFIHAQASIKNDYIPPMNIPLILSGNFGEFRSNHFHTGIDIKTQGVQGKKLYAVADGVVSRVKISPSGYGKALYIDHPDGNTTVYAHMKSFTDEIEAFMLKEQYKQQTFDINYYPDSAIFTFKQGDVIGLSGNTGHSGGPHLHFEIRNTETEHPINPLLFGFDIKDDIDPILRGIRIYPIGENSMVDGSTNQKSYTLKSLGKGKYKTEKDTILIGGDFGIGVHTIDKMNDANNTYSVYRLRIKSNDEVIYSHVMDELDFETSRYLNAHMDYALFKRNKWRYHKCFPAANNKLAIYESLSTTSHVKPGEVTKFLVETSDVEGNSVGLEFVVKGVAKKEKVDPDSTELLPFYANQDNAFENENIRIAIPAQRLYDDTNFIFDEKVGSKGDKSKIFTLGNPEEGLQEEMFITIKLNDLDSANNKIKLYQLGRKDRWQVCDSEVRGQYVFASSKSFGKFVLKEDDSNPAITLKNFPKTPSARSSKVTFSLSDNLSGVVSVNAYVDGEWFMMRHNVAKSYAYGYLKELGLEKGDHEFKLVAIDACGNEKTYTKSFKWN